MLRNDRLDEGRARTELVVMLHGYTFDGSKMSDMVHLVRKMMPDADILLPDTPIRHYISLTRSTDIVAAFLDRLDEACAKVPAYQRIWIIGYSCGAMLARKLFLAAWGASPDVPGGERARAWAPAIERLMFVSGLNAGWIVTGALDWKTTMVWSIFERMGDVLFCGRPTIFDFRLGSPFLTETRLQWLRLMNKDGRWRDVTLVQTLGKIDDVVSPESTVDWAVDANGGNFFPIAIPHTGHFDAMELYPEGDALKDARRDETTKALARDPEALRAIAVDPGDLVDALEIRPDRSVTDVAFVIHGIRDRGYWTQKIAAGIRKLSRELHCEPGLEPKRVFQTVPGRYGYFAMLPFLLRSERASKVRWFSDLYVRYAARYPNAQFHFVGHSNGTYLLARALSDCPSMRVGRVVFAGSVVRTDYDWGTLLRAGRVEKVMNYCASKDWVVAILPRSFEPLRWFDIGGAGFIGFHAARPPNHDVEELRFVQGPHNAGISESQWDEIATFIVKGNAPGDTWISNPDFAASPPTWLKILAASPSLVLLLAVTILGGILLWAWYLAQQAAGGGIAAGILVALVILWVLRVVFFRV